MLYLTQHENILRYKDVIFAMLDKRKHMNYLKFLSIGLIVFISGLDGQAQTEGYHLKFKITGLRDSLVYLANHYGDKQYLKDSVHVDAAGRFSFSGKEKLAGGIYLIVLPGKKYFEILVDKNQHFLVETDVDDPSTKMSVTGSPDNTKFYQYLNFIKGQHKRTEPLKIQLTELKDDHAREKEIKDQLARIDKEVKEYQSKLIAENPKSLVSVILKTTSEPEMPETPLLENGKKDSVWAFNYYKTHYFDNVDFSDERLLYSPLIYSKVNQYIKNLTVQLPDSINAAADYIIAKARVNKEMFKYVVHFITYTYETSTYMGMDAVFVHMAEKYYSPDQAFWMDEAQLFKVKDRASIIKPLLIGKKAPSLMLQDTVGSNKPLYDVKSEYTILYFWDPDCGHCKKVTPLLKDYYNKMKGKGIEVYAVYCEVEEDKWKKYINENQLKWLNVWDSTKKFQYKRTYDISSTPVAYLLDKNKEIIAKKLSVEQIEEFIESRSGNKQ
jgi:thiol-disulfide isomerase/thioredoxin